MTQKQNFIKSEQNRDGQGVKMIKGVLFDVDGTILDSFNAIYAALSRVLRKFNVEDFKSGELKAMMDYQSFGEIVLTLAKRYNFLDSDRILELSKDYLTYFEESVKTGMKLYPGIVEVIENIMQEFKVGVISYNPGNIVKIQLEYFDLNRYFPFVRGFEEINGRKREGILEFSKLYGIGTEEIVYIGDQPKDVIEARMAGARSIAVTYGISGYETLSKEHPDFMAAHPEDILEIIRKI